MNGEYSPAKAWWDQRQWSEPIADADFRARVFAAIDRRYRVWIGDAQTRNLEDEDVEPGTSLSWEDLTNEATTLRRGPRIPLFGDQWAILLCTIEGTSKLTGKWFYILFRDIDTPSHKADGDETSASASQSIRASAILIDWELQTLVDWIQEATELDTGNHHLQDGPITQLNVIEYVKFALMHDLTLGEGRLCRPVESADDLISSARFNWSKEDSNSSASELSVKLENIEPIKDDTKAYRNQIPDESASELGQRTKEYRIVGHFVVGRVLRRCTFIVTNLGEVKLESSIYAQPSIARVPVEPVFGETLSGAGYLPLERVAEEWRFAPPRHINDLLAAIKDNELLETFRKDAEQALQNKRRSARFDATLMRANDPCTEGEDVSLHGKKRPIPIVCEGLSTNIGEPYSSQITQLRILFKQRVEFRACTFEGPVDFSNCRFMKGLVIAGCVLKGKLDLQSCEINYTGIRTKEEATKTVGPYCPLDLSFSTIQQDLDLRGVTLKTAYNSGWSLYAVHLRLEGDLDLRGLRSNGSLIFMHASIDGAVQLGQDVRGRARRQSSIVEGIVDFRGAHIRGYLQAEGLIADSFDARRACFDGTLFFWWCRSFSYGDWVLTQTRFRYGLVLRGAHIKGELQLCSVICGSSDPAADDNSDEAAVDACDIEVDGVVLVLPMMTENKIRAIVEDRASSSEVVTANHCCHVLGDFNLSGAILRRGIAITSAKIVGNVDFSHANIDGDILLESALPLNPCGALLSGPFVNSIRFGDDVWPTFDLLEVSGMIDFRHACIGGSVHMHGVISGRKIQAGDDRANNQTADGINFEYAHIRGSYISLDEGWINRRQNALDAMLRYCKLKLEKQEQTTLSNSQRVNSSVQSSKEKRGVRFVLPTAEVMKTDTAVKSANRIYGELNFRYAKIDGAVQIDNNSVSGPIVLSNAVIGGDVTCSWPNWLTAPPGYDVPPPWVKNESRTADKQRDFSGYGRTLCTRFEMVGLSCLADVDISGLVIDVSKKAHGPTNVESEKLADDERGWPSLDGRRAGIAGTLQLARRCPGMLELSKPDARHVVLVYSVIRGQLNLSYARAGQLLLSGTSFQNGARRGYFREKLNRLLGWPKSLYRDDCGKER